MVQQKIVRPLVIGIIIVKPLMGVFMMDEGRLKKLEEQLYNQTPFLADMLRQKAARELLEARNPQALELVIRAYCFFSGDRGFRNLVLNFLRQVKIQETELIDVVCRVWAETRDGELAKILKLKGWVASHPLQIKVLTALNLGWRGILEEKGKAVISPLLEIYSQETDAYLKNTAREWLSSLATVELQGEVCRLASEENNAAALEIARECGYIPSEAPQAALFCYFTQQWELFRQIDPEFELMAEVYQNASPQLRQRIDQHGTSLSRLEWVWTVLGGKKGKRVGEITANQWQAIIQTLSRGKEWEILWQMLSFAPAVYSIPIVKKLETKRLSIKDELLKKKIAEVAQILRNINTNTPPQGNLVRCLHVLENHPQAVEAIAVTPDAKNVITASGELIYIWNLDSGKLTKTLKGHLKPVTSLSLNEDGTILAAGSRDKTVSLWRLPEGNLITRLSANVASVWSLAMTKNAKLIASASYQEVRLWQYPQARLFKSLRGFSREVQKVIISPDDTLLIACGGKRDNSIRIWRLPDGDHLYNLFGHEDGVWDLVVTPDSRTLASASQDCTIKLWSLDEGREIATLEEHFGRVWCLGITPDGKTLVSGSSDSTVKVWNLADNTVKFSLEGHSGSVFCLDISPDGRLLATGGSDGIVQLWNLETGENINTLDIHQSYITAIQFTTDGRNLITAGGDGKVAVWGWDLSRLCYLSPRLLTEEDKQWLRESLAENRFSPEEKYWVLLLEKLQEICNNNGN